MPPFPGTMYGGYYGGPPRGHPPGWGYPGYGPPLPPPQGAGAPISGEGSSPPGYPKAAGGTVVSGGSGSSRSTRGGRSPTHTSSSNAILKQQHQQQPYLPTSTSLSSPPKSSPGEKSTGADGSEAMVETARTIDDFEKERIRNTETAELTLNDVKPIQSDFHFFVHAMRDKLRLEAEEEIRRTNSIAELDIFLVNTNLNNRILKAWEDLDKDERDRYMDMEEDDRKRFMEEDEVASRHCFTLTARIRSDAAKKSDAEKGDSPGEDHAVVKGSTSERNGGGHNVERDGSDADDAESDADALEQSGDDEEEATATEEVKRSKRPDGIQDESPTKKNRMSEESTEVPI